MNLDADRVTPDLVERMRRRVAASGEVTVIEIHRARDAGHRTSVCEDLDIERRFLFARGRAGLDADVGIQGGACRGNRGYRGGGRGDRRDRGGRRGGD